MTARVLKPETSGDDDVALMARVAAGNLDALGELFDRHEHSVRGLIRRLGVAPADIDDLVQVTFLDLARGAARYDHAQSLRSWLLGMAAMTVRRHRRSVSRWVANLAGRIYEQRRALPRTPCEDLERHQDQARFEIALARLPAKQREVFVLVAMEGASGEEVAAALRIPVNTVWTRLHYARKELRSLLGEDS